MIHNRNIIMIVFASVSSHLCNFFWISRFFYVFMSCRNFYKPCVITIPHKYKRIL